ncbi:hypothetical protein ACHAWO_007302 [Cyclotella atomus]|uniref:Secreted protein n=1 Tax=Cyclotella atomus TaxID=382360 RepID=A0ABD3MTR8_9STRA
MWLDAAGILAGGVRYDCVAVVAVRLMSMAGTIVAEAARPLLCNICSPLLPCFYKEKMPQHCIGGGRVGTEAISRAPPHP